MVYLILLLDRHAQELENAEIEDHPALKIRQRSERANQVLKISNAHYMNLSGSTRFKQVLSTLNSYSIINSLE